MGTSANSSKKILKANLGGKLLFQSPKLLVRVKAFFLPDFSKILI
jgi:hypothetical protein